ETHRPHEFLHGDAAQELDVLERLLRQLGWLLGRLATLATLRVAHGDEQQTSRSPRGRPDERRASEIHSRSHVSIMWRIMAPAPPPVKRMAAPHKPLISLT